MPLNRLRRRYARVYHSLGRAELQRGATDATALDLEELFSPTSELWLGFYTREGVEFALEQYGFFDDLRRRGYESLRTEVRTEDADEQLMRIRSVLPMCEQPLVELVARRTQLSLRAELADQLQQEALHVLSLEWLQLQHPLEGFDAERPPLPGQLLPGLGLSRQIFELMRNVCRRLKLDALVTIPSFYHNAVFYHLGFQYLDPLYEGKLRELERGLGASSELTDRLKVEPLAALSWATQWGLVQEHEGSEDELGHRFEWFHEPMVSALTPKLERYLQGEWYLSEIKAARATHHYTWAEGAVERKLAERGVAPFDEARVGPLIEEQRGEL